MYEKEQAAQSRSEVDVNGRSTSYLLDMEVLSYTSHDDGGAEALKRIKGVSTSELAVIPRTDCAAI